MVISVSGLIFSIILGGIGAIIVLLCTAGLNCLFKLVCRFFSWMASNFKKWKNRS